MRLGCIGLMGTVGRESLGVGRTGAVQQEDDTWVVVASAGRVLL
jgi:hypothetical protein